MKKPVLVFMPYLGFEGPKLDSNLLHVFTLAIKWGVLESWLYAAIRSGQLQADKTMRPMTISRKEAFRFQTDCILPLIDEHTFVRDHMDDWPGERRDPDAVTLLKASDKDHEV